MGRELGGVTEDSVKWFLVKTFLVKIFLVRIIAKEVFRNHAQTELIHRIGFMTYWAEADIVALLASDM